MRWTKVRIKNFLSIKDAELSLDERGLMLIEGRNQTNEAFQSNGSGKSNLLHSIVYAIYDTTPKGVRADDVVNNVEKKNTEVILEGENGEDKYRIERYRKHSKHKNKVFLYINGKDVSESTVRETNAAIEQVVGIDYNTFINSIMFSQGSGAGRFATATDREKKEILENLVNLGVYAEAQEIAKERVKDKQEEINENLRGTERLNWEISNIDMMEQQDEENYEQTKTMIQQEMDNIAQKTTELSDYASKYFPQTEKVRAELEELKEKRDTQNGEDISGLSDQVNEKYLALQNKMSEHKQLISKKDEIVAQYKKVQNDTHCPICGTELDAQHRNKELESLKEQLRPILVSIQAVTAEEQQMNTEYNELYAKYQERKQAHDTAHEAFRALVQDIQNKEDIVRTYETTLQQIKDTISNSQSTLNKLNKVPQPRPRGKERKDIQDKIKAQKTALLALEKEKTQIEDVVKVYSNSGVRSHVLDLITPFLNERANTYLNKLSGSDIEVKFTTQTRNKSGEMTDKFDIQVFNSTGGETYQANSEGEKKRIDLAISLAIQDLVISRTNLSTNLVIYDEVFDALDGIGSENVISLLKERLETVGTIFVITHSDHLKPLFEEVITVTKTKQGESKVTEGAGTT